MKLTQEQIEVIKDYEIGMKVMTEKFNCKTLKETTK